MRNGANSSSDGRLANGVPNLRNLFIFALACRWGGGLRSGEDKRNDGAREGLPSLCVETLLLRCRSRRCTRGNDGVAELDEERFRYSSDDGRRRMTLALHLWCSLFVGVTVDGGVNPVLGHPVGMGPARIAMP